MLNQSLVVTIDNYSFRLLSESLPFETCIFCKKVGHISSYCPQHMNSRMRFKCGANGHIARDCEGQKSGEYF